jgi:predicted ATP-grasp superfamily ATP-dependent carboligase
MSAPARIQNLNRHEALPSPGVWARQINGAARRTGHRPAIVLCAAYSGLAIIRSLGRHGIPVFALDSRPFEVGMHSRHGRGIVLPQPPAHSAAWLEFIAATGRLLDCRPVLFVAGDPQLELLSAGRENLSRFYEFAIPDRHVCEMLIDKRSQYRWLMNRKVNIPATSMPESEAEAKRDALRIGLPCIAKPGVSHLWRAVSKSKALVLRSPDEAGDAYRKMTESGAGCLLQEIVPGGDDQLYGTLCCFSRLGEPLASLTKRKLRQFPERFGNGSVQISVRLPELAEHSVSVLRSLGCHGFVSIEYKLDPVGGAMKLIEINPRSVSGLQLAIDSGCDLPWVGYCDLAGLPPPAVRPQREGVLFVNEAWELRRVRQTGRPLDWIGYFATLLRARSHAVFSLEDPGPAWSLVMRALGR